MPAIMPTILTRRKVVLRRVGCGVAVVGLACLAFWLFVRTWRHEVGTYSFEPDVEIRLFVESDLDNPPGLFYEIRRGARRVVPPTYLDLAPDRDDPLDLERGTSADGSVIGLWSTGDFEILYHLPSGESWPRLLDHESLLQPAVGAKWRDRASLLRERHPELPPPEMLIRGRRGS